MGNYISAYIRMFAFYENGKLFMEYQILFGIEKAERKLTLRGTGL